MRQHNKLRLYRRKTKQGYIMFFIFLVLFCLIGGIFLYNAVLKNKEERYRILEIKAIQAVQSNNYKVAVDYYEELLCLQKQKKLTYILGLSDCYIHMKDYEKAIEILEKAYRRRKCDSLREKLLQAYREEKKIEYTQRIRQAQKYINANNNNRAIKELRYAMELCPEKEEAIRLMICVYIEEGKLDQAWSTLESEKKNLTEEAYLKLSHRLEKQENTTKYGVLLSTASEFLSQDDFDTSIELYKEAILLKPDRVEGYRKLVKAYISREDYNNAINVIQKGLVYNKSVEMYQLLWDTQDIMQQGKCKDRLLRQIYDALKNKDENEVKGLIASALYKLLFPHGVDYVYSMSCECMVNSLVDGEGCKIYRDGSIYVGEFCNGIREGNGILFRSSSSVLGYSLYTGEWENDTASGEGEYISTTFTDVFGNRKEYKIKVCGDYNNNYENGYMTRYYYDDTQEIGRINYRCVAGIPQPNFKEGLEEKIELVGTYAIGTVITSNNKYSYEYTIGAEKLWGI